MTALDVVSEVDDDRRQHCGEGNHHHVDAVIEACNS